MKYLDRAPYFNREGEDVKECDGRGETPGEFREGMVVHVSHSLFYFILFFSGGESSIKKRSGGKREAERESEIILHWNLDSRAHRPRSQSNRPV